MRGDTTAQPNGCVPELIRRANQEGTLTAAEIAEILDVDEQNENDSIDFLVSLPEILPEFQIVLSSEGRSRNRLASRRAVPVSDARSPFRKECRAARRWASASAQDLTASTRWPSTALVGSAIEIVNDCHDPSIEKRQPRYRAAGTAASVRHSGNRTGVSVTVTTVGFSPMSCSVRYSFSPPHTQLLYVQQ